jgi:hypothetical protein
MSEEEAVTELVSECRRSVVLDPRRVLDDDRGRVEVDGTS